MRVLLITSDQDHCGIREYGRQLRGACAAPGLEIEEFPHTHPDSLFTYLGCPRAYDVIHLNHHAALHAAWKPEHIAKLQALGYAVVVTQHDTFETWELMQERGFTDFSLADGLVVHEPVAGLAHQNLLTVSQGVPENTPGAELLSTPTLGLFGFDFPWKGFDTACEAAGLAGWSVRLISPNISVERAEALQRLANVEVIAGWGPTDEVVQLLAQCWATAFLYSCGNSGTSGAVRLGIAAGSPVIASRGCRQFRDLEQKWPGSWSISWVSNKADIIDELLRLRAPLYHIARAAADRYLATHDSWTHAAACYHAVYQRATTHRKELGS